ncbi:hypothetical protein A2U01_0070078, partial [Trifolium medium]|nr:hypothetical protein [Trifolium medium]
RKDILQRVAKKTNIHGGGGEVGDNGGGDAGFNRNGG